MDNPLNQLTALPKLAIVGRPNVGKSALFNRICQKRVAIVDAQEGITRDRIYEKADFFGQPFLVIDTGGIDPTSTVSFNEKIRQQTDKAIEEADALVLVVDGKAGVTKLDQEIAKWLHQTKKPLTLAVNKIDDPDQELLIHPFHCLGISKLVDVSAQQGYHIAELIEIALKGIVFSSEPIQESQTKIRVAIVGRPNVGKSTLMNYLLQDERCLVSPVPGTTRDSIDVDIQVGEQWFTLVDTAGIRRKKSEKEVVDKFAAMRTQKAIERADICILMASSEEGVTAQEKKIAKEIETLGKGCILLFNKWDLVKGFRMEHCLATLREEVSFLNFCPRLFISAKTGRNLETLYSLIRKVSEESSRRVTTGQLNKFLEKAMQQYHPPMLQGRRLRVYYMSQVEASPPKFVLFVNNPKLMVDSYKKYLINQLRENFGFAGVPLFFSLRGKKEREEESVPAEALASH